MGKSAAAASPIGSEHRASAAKRARGRAYRQARVRTEFAEAVAQFLIRYRKRHNLTQRGLAKLLGMQESVIRRLENGDQTPNPAALERIVEFLNAHFNFVLEER
ncbi:MAG: helix-turn-helix transcriptional regulator [Candidatus Eremiobacteraeota bacterium]|nr:helix-turn-helix transcriptional regulator [Candidatus Eremiobacteraeota bacterium]